MSELMPGMRVKVKADPIGYTLTNRFGTVGVLDKDWHGWWRVRLDHPAPSVIPGQEPIWEVVAEYDALEWWEQTTLPLDDKVKINPKWAWEG